MTTSGISPYATNAHNHEMLRQVRANRLEGRLRKGRVHRELLGSEDSKRRMKGCYGPVYASTEYPASPGKPKEGRRFLAREAVLPRHWGRGLWVWFAGPAREVEATFPGSEQTDPTSGATPSGQTANDEPSALKMALPAGERIGR